MGFISANSEPVVQVRLILARMVVVSPAVVLVAVWFWATVVHPMPSPSVLLLGILTGVASLVSVLHLRGLMRNLLHPQVGFIVRGESRAETRAKREKSRQDLRVAAVTLPVGALIGAILTSASRVLIG